MDFLHSLLGLSLLGLIPWLISENRQAASLRLLLIGVLLQLVLAVVLLKLPFFQQLFLYLNEFILALQTATKAGTSFVFGYLGGAELPFDEHSPGGAFILGFQALPIILVMSALSAVLFYWRVLPALVKAMALLLQKSLNIGGALGLGAAANVFVGMVEAPLLIRPYLARMTRSELFSLMTLGMATIAGTVLVLYATLLEAVIPNAIGHILTASLLSAPAAIVVSKLMIPETQAATEGQLETSGQASSTMDAITRGTADGLYLLAHIVALLVVLVALVSLVNLGLAALPSIAGEALSLERILGWLMAPVTWLMGVSWAETQVAGALMGVKTVLNEFLAYHQLSQLPEDSLSERSRLILLYALCGFANFGSLGIMLAGMGAMVPERRDEIVSLGMKSLLSGTLATCMTGAVVGLVLLF